MKADEMLGDGKTSENKRKERREEAPNKPRRARNSGASAKDTSSKNGKDIHSFSLVKVSVGR
jgi:hypothetical protein